MRGRGSSFAPGVCARVCAPAVSIRRQLRTEHEANEAKSELLLMFVNSVALTLFSLNLLNKSMAPLNTRDITIGSPNVAILF